MKNYTFLIALLFLCFCGTLAGQSTTKPKSTGRESFGNTLNVGLGLGYYGYVGHAMPAIHADFEFQVAPSFTLAPFVTVYSYRNYQYWGNPAHPYQNYYYRHTVIPIGVKGTYYFDRLLKAGAKWDFYLAGSLGITLHSTTWQNGYEGETVVDHSTTGVYLDAHIGAEYHIASNLGLFLDLSTGLSTFGIAVHL